MHTQTATMIWWVFWFLGLFYTGWRTTISTDRYWGGGSLVGWLLVGYLGYVVLHMK